MVGMGYTLGSKLVELVVTTPGVSKLGLEDHTTNIWMKRNDFQPILRIGDRLRYEFKSRKLMN